MNTIPWSAILAVMLGCSLSLMLGWLFGRRGKSNAPLGLPEGSIRGILAITVTVAVVLYPAFSELSVPNFLENAFLIIIGLYFGNRGATPPAPTAAPTTTTGGLSRPEPWPAPPPSTLDALKEQARNGGGFIRPQTLLLSLGVGVTLLLAAALLTGCGTLGDGKVGTTQIDARQAEKVGLAVADRIGGDKVKPFTTSAKALLGGEEPAAQPGELVSDGYFDYAGNPLNSGVRRVKIFRAVEEIAAPAPVPPAAEPSVPHSSRGPSVSSGAGGATDVPKVPAQPAPEKRDTTSHGAATSAGTLNLPPPVQVRNSSTTEPQGPAQAPGTSGTLSTARLVQVEARIVAVESPIADQLRDAVAVLELVIERGKVSGRVLSISNTPAAAQLDLKRLHFDGVAASVSEQGLVTAASPPGAEIQFEASLDEYGNLRATAVPAAGSPAALFFQRVELAGRPLLNQYGVIITNVPPAPPVEEGILKSARWAPFPKVAFDAPVIETWPREGDKGVCAQLFLNGRKVEWIAAGRQWSTVHNALPVPVKDKDGKVIGYERGKYFQDLKSGDRVTISIADLKGRNESNRKELVVP